MPELPEVETVVRDVRPQTVGRTISKVVHASAKMSDQPRRELARGLEGERILALDRHGKWMFFRLPRSMTLVVHLGMTGRLAIYAADAPRLPHTHVRLALEDGRFELRFCDPRRFGEFGLYDRSRFSARFGAGKLGPDARFVTKSQLSQALGRSGRNLKAALLDQKTVAGLGNIYVDEALFRARLSPRRRGRDLSGPELARLTAAIRSVLRQAIDRHGSSIRDFLVGEGTPGEYHHYLQVYGRGNQPCKKCSTAIELDRRIVSGRASHFCPRCQPDEP